VFLLLFMNNGLQEKEAAANGYGYTHTRREREQFGPVSIACSFDKGAGEEAKVTHAFIF
jgi:hypothetical protein